MSELLMDTFVDAGAQKFGDGEFYIVVGEVRFTIEKMIRDGVERGIVRVIDGVMVVFVHRLWLVVEMVVVVHDVFRLATDVGEDTREDMMITNSMSRVTFRLEALFTTDKV